MKARLLKKIIVCALTVALSMQTVIAVNTTTVLADETAVSAEDSELISLENTDIEEVNMEATSADENVVADAGENVDASEVDADVVVDASEEAADTTAEVANENTDAEPSTEETESNYPAQNFGAEENGVQVSVVAPEGAFPENTVMKVTPVDDQAVLDQAIATADGDAHTKAVAVDIAFYVNEAGEEKEIEPATAIQVTLKAEEISKNESATIVHVDDENNGSVVKETSAEEQQEGTVVFESNQFSAYAIVYTVDFTYYGSSIRIDGGESILLSEILESLQIKDEEENTLAITDVESVEFSDENLVRITAENSDWKLESLQAFNTEEELTLHLVNGEDVVIVVTDDNNASTLVGSTIFFAANLGTKAWANKDNLYVYTWGGENKAAFTAMSSFTVNGNKYFYCKFDSSVDATNFLLCTQSNFNSGRDQTQNQSVTTSTNGSVFYLSTNSTSSTWAALAASTDSLASTLGISSLSGKEIGIVDMVGSGVSAVEFTNLLGESTTATVSNGKVTVPDDPASGLPYTSMTINGLEVSLIDSTDGVSGTYSSSTNTLYYGATTDTNGNVVASYWSESKSNGNISGLTIYFDTNYSFTVDGVSVDVKPTTIGAVTVYYATIPTSVASDSILTVTDSTTGFSYNFYWTDTTHDLLEISNDIAEVSANSSKYNATAITSAEQLASCVGSSNGGSYYLDADIIYDAYINVTSAVTLDLNGHTINHNGSGYNVNNNPLFDVKNGGTLNLVDSRAGSETVTKNYSASNVYGNVASFSSNRKTLTYYVTESAVNSDGIRTTETVTQHVYTYSGGIISTQSSGNVITVENGGTFNQQSGLIASNTGADHVVSNAGTYNLSGGYITGANSTSNTSWGKGVYSTGIFNLNGGVIAANQTYGNGGGVYINGGTFNMAGGVISGNISNSSSSKEEEYNGGGVYVSNGATVEISGGYITNNEVIGGNSTDAFGQRGGGGLAITGAGNAAAVTFTMSGGYVTGNHSAASGGGLFLGRNSEIPVNYTFSGGTIASNVCDTGEGGGVRIATGATGSITGASDTYITNNKNNTSDSSSPTWGGGGIFVQTGGSLYLSFALITKNSAGGYGGGFAACPTGDAYSVSNDGAAIFDNSAAGKNVSGGTGGKDKDTDLKNGGSYKHTDTGETETYGDTEKNFFAAGQSGYLDYFSAGNAVINGSMLGDTTANWAGLVDGRTYSAGDIGEYDLITANLYAGLTANPTDEDKTEAISLAKVFISGNYSGTHGGGVMTNGNVYLGTATTESYPSLRLTGSKSMKELDVAFTDAELAAYEDKFKFLIVTSASEPYVTQSGISFNYDEVIATASMKSDGSFALNWDFPDDGSTTTMTYYLVEQTGSLENIIYDSTVYKIVVTLGDTYTPNKVTYHLIKSIEISKAVLSDDKQSYSWKKLSTDSDYTDAVQSDYSHLLTMKGSTFTNVYSPPYELPDTGGAGTGMLAVGGLACMATGTLLKQKRKRRERRVRT